MDTIDISKIAIQPIKSFQKYKVDAIDMLRLDLIHNEISGNKWFKLQRNIEYAIANDFKTVITFGGAFSNHLLATAAAAKEYEIKSVGIVRGEYLTSSSSETLTKCEEMGMQLHFMSKEVYKQKENVNWLHNFSEQHPDSFIIPEGGANEQGKRGAQEMSLFIPDKYSHICISVGTGTSLIGIRNTLSVSKHILGFVPMKDGNYLKPTIEKQLFSLKNKHWKLYDDYHFGGFGKWNTELIEFMNSFYEANTIPLDVVYTSKMMFGLQQQLQENHFPKNAKILCIHTGGLQGNDSVKEQLVWDY